MTSDFEREAREVMSLGNEKLDESMRRSPRGPLVILARQDDVTGDVSPGVKVGVRPLGDRSGLAPREVAAVLMVEMGKVVPSFQPDGPARDAKVGGLAAGHFQARFVTEWIDGTHTLVQTRIWVIPRGEDLILVGATNALPSDAATESEFSQILNSIRIAEPGSADAGR